MLDIQKQGFVRLIAIHHDCRRMVWAGSWGIQGPPEYAIAISSSNSET